MLGKMHVSCFTDYSVAGFLFLVSSISDQVQARPMCLQYIYTYCMHVLSS